MAITVGSNFKVSTNLPIEERMVVTTITARDAIPNNLRYEGMITYVEADKKNYQLRGGITNNYWVNANLIDPTEINAYDKQEIDDLIAVKLTDKAYVDQHIADTVKHVSPTERTNWNNKLDKAGNASQNIALKQVTVYGPILPGKDALDIGSPTQRFKNIYVDEAHLSTNTLYIGDTPILGTEADTINIKADPNQSICMQTSAIGTTSIISEKGIDIATSGMNSSVTIQTTGTNSQTNIAATARVNVDAPAINLKGDTTIEGNLNVTDLSVTGNFNVAGTVTTVNATNLEISDNIIDINKGEKGQGVAEGMAGIKIDRGDLGDVLLVFDETDDQFKVGESANLLTLATEKYVYDHRYIHPAGTNPHGTTKADVGLGNVTNESKTTLFTSPTFTGVPKAPTAAENTNTTQLATTAFVMRETAKKANSTHGHHVPTPETANARKFLRNDNSWQVLPNATTANTGLVKLNDAVNATSVTEAATANAVRITYNLAASKANNTLVTTTANGLMAKEDKVKLNSVQTNANYYVHPTTHNASMIVQDTSHRFITDDERTRWDATTGTSASRSYVDSTFLKLTGGMVTGQTHFDTRSAVKPLIISRFGELAECLKIGVADSQTDFYYTNDEKNSTLNFTLCSMDKENSDGTNASVHVLKFYGSNLETFLAIDDYKFYHQGFKPTLKELGASPVAGSSSLSQLAKHVTFGEGKDFSIIQENGELWQKIAVSDVSTLSVHRFQYLEKRGKEDYVELFGVDGNGEIYAKNKKVYHEGNKPTYVDVGAEPAFTKNTAFNKNFGGNGAATTVSRSDHYHTHIETLGKVLCQEGAKEITEPSLSMAEVYDDNEGKYPTLFGNILNMKASSGGSNQLLMGWSYRSLSTDDYGDYVGLWVRNKRDIKGCPWSKWYQVYTTGFKPTKADVGLSNVDNTSDLNKPISTAMQTALNAKETPAGAQAKATAALTSAKAYTDTKITDLIGGSKDTLDTLKELADALGNDPNFATTITTKIGSKADKTYVDGTFLKLTGGSLSGDLRIVKDKPLLILEQTTDNHNLPTIEFKHPSGQNIELAFNIYDSTRIPFGLHLRRHSSNPSKTDKAYLDVEGDIYSNGKKVYHQGFKPTPAEIGAAPATVVTASTNGLMSKQDKEKLDKIGDILSLTKYLTLTTEWQDVGIEGEDLEAGSYIVQISGMYEATGIWREIFTGVMSWTSETTNSYYADEILLHKAGHASEGRHIYLRTTRQPHPEYLKLQICCSHELIASTFTFKFRKLI